MEFKDLLYTGEDGDLVSLLPNVLSLKGNRILKKRSNIFLFNITYLYIINPTNNKYQRFVITDTTDILVNEFKKLYFNISSQQVMNRNKIQFSERYYSFVLVNNEIRLFEYYNNVKQIIMHNAHNKIVGYNVRQLKIRKNFVNKYGRTFTDLNDSKFENESTEIKFKSENQYINELTELGILKIIEKHYKERNINSNLEEIYELIVANDFTDILNNSVVCNQIKSTIRAQKLTDIYGI